VKEFKLVYSELYIYI